MQSHKDVTIYTDGACSGNPGPGGYGVVLLWQNRRKELSGGFRRTTSNRMELMAAIVGLRALKRPCQVVLYTDSKYLQEAFSLGWAKRWRACGWMRNKDEQARNHDLWEQLLDAASIHEVIIKWIPGHTGNSDNERCDQLAVAACAQRDLPADQGFENQFGLADSPLFRETNSGKPQADPAKLCLRCRKPIPDERLEAMPYTVLCVVCQRSEEAASENISSTGVECPRCAAKGIRAELVWRTARDSAVPGYFLGCSRFPSCRYVEAQ